MNPSHGHLVFGVTYHGSVSEPLHGLDNFYGKHISARKLREQLEWLRRHFHVLTLNEIFKRLQTRRLPKRTAFIAFHDGYVGNYETALPLLRELDIKAGFYVPTAFVDTKLRFWVDVLDAAIKYTKLTHVAQDIFWESPVLPLSSESHRLNVALLLRRRLKALPQQTMALEFEKLIEALGWKNPSEVPYLGQHDHYLSWTQVKEMAQAGMEIGSHTHHHVICGVQDEKTLRNEMQQSKSLCENQLQIPCRYLCYPDGDYPKGGNDYTDRIARECGYEAVLYMISPYNYINAQSFRLTGIAIGEESSDQEFKRALSPFRFRLKRMRRRAMWPWDAEPDATTGL